MVEWEGLGMGSTSFLTKPKSAGFRAKSGSSVGSDRETNGKLKRSKIRRPMKMNDYGLKRIPDYTELAYKEAVSKLRYFLSGNYAPSARSYGGSASIKNLDESDGDLDKKYSSSYNAVGDFKPKPRLTAKYATLYADSLKNYTPEPVNVPTSAGAGDSSTANPDVINFIHKQEEYIEQLERESQYCRDELNNLLGKVKEVISENEHLHEAQKNKLISRMFHSYNGSETDDVDDSTGLDSDNKTSPSKARKTSKARGTRLEGPNIVFESRIAELEAQLTQSKIDLKKLQDENNENKRKLASGLVDSTCLDGFKRQIDNLQRDKSTLEAQISKLKLSLEQREDDSGRYRRTEVVEQQLREDKNSLEAEIRSLKEELSKERARVRELAGAGARGRARAEHLDDLHHDLAAQYDTVARLQLDLDRQRREENDLKRELTLKNSAVEELKMELKNKTASLQADLSQAHAEKASLEEELASARLALERHQRQTKHETNRLNSEIQSLRQRLDRADADLVHSRRENLRLSEQISNLEKEINLKSLSPISSEKNKKEKELSTMLESIDNKHAKTVAELEGMIHSQNSLMEKLTGECRLLTDKLDDANRRHKAEKTQLLCRNAELMRKLRSLWCSHKRYCTTTVARSSTPLSGYPHSRSSYDLDRTYRTSTPFTNRFRSFSSRDHIGGLVRNLSDLSLDRVDDSDVEPSKGRIGSSAASSRHSGQDTPAAARA
uniref:Serologically defined colon cancer antigen 8 homolog n=1 Tax=Bombyx mori TaxID=7091 RepID=A0A8R2HQ95_BOMMO|nr:serologically defined colon cancer antigen 8 homolog isoform X3 [Bombyx mori]